MCIRDRDKSLVVPLDNASNVMWVGVRACDPLEQWVSGPIALLGDAAHPPVPYIGQGVQMTIKDTGIAAHLLKDYCPAPNGNLTYLVFQKQWRYINKCKLHGLD
eukprot:9668747-Ditylum_brightwellii.AAC.1